MIDENFSLVLIKWYNLNKRNLPWRNTNDPYKIWISEIILQQTRVEQGLPYYNKFILNFPNIIKLSQAKEDKVLKLWQGLGYYSRARNLHFTSKYITEKLNGEFPKNYDGLIKLKGVGKYTASAISSFAYNEKKAVLDGNVFRVLSRYFGVFDPIDSTLGLKLFEEISFKNLPIKNIATYNQSIMEFGALQCKPASPNCELCPLNFNCWAFLNNKISSLPVKNKKIIKKERFFNFIVLANEKFVFIEKRIKNDIWKNLYQFPLFEDSDLNFKPAKDLVKNGVLLKKTKIKHILTHQRLNVVFWHYNVNKLEKNKKYKTIEIKKIDQYPVPKIVENYIAENLRIDLI
ncbi:A/G-specific adenine glycosylase [Flavobacteriales bacterium]|nr:A/G-specific adenine glycosylase [Flavobacteriales bacterium]|tara:strand:+ start:1224 stop:2261 length:1038 start_codon:yes stop_codon:yes gene_type:complete